MLTLAQIGDKYASRLGASSQAYKDGVGNVTENPMAKAAANLEVAKQNYIAAIDSGRMAAGLNAVSLSDWKSAAQNVGAAKLAASATAAKAKYLKRMQVIYPKQQEISQEISRMPKGTLDYGKARALKAIDMMAQLKGLR